MRMIWRVIAWATAVVWAVCFVLGSAATPWLSAALIALVGPALVVSLAKTVG